MKSAVRYEYGNAEQLLIKEIETPVINENEILIKVFATTVNRTDCAILTGSPFIMRFFTGLSKPKNPTTGTDFAGKVVEVGKNIKGFSVGDRVWGFNDEGLGSHAEYMKTTLSNVVKKIPDNISYEQAAASAEAAHYAFNFLSKVNIKPNHKVLLNGATGAIGSAALQFLKNRGIYVTATCNTENIEKIKNLGADKIIDYTKEDFTKDNEKYNFVFDSVGKSTFGKCKPIMTNDGIYISSELGPKCQNPFLAIYTPIFSKKKVIFPFPINIDRSLTYVNTLLESKQFLPLIDRVYQLEQISEAFKYVFTGEKIGNVILQIAEEK